MSRRPPVTESKMQGVSLKGPPGVTLGNMCVKRRIVSIAH